MAAEYGLTTEALVQWKTASAFPGGAGLGSLGEATSRGAEEISVAGRGSHRRVAGLGIQLGADGGATEKAARRRISNTSSAIQLCTVGENSGTEKTTRYGDNGHVYEIPDSEEDALSLVGCRQIEIADSEDDPLSLRTESSPVSETMRANNNYPSSGFVDLEAEGLIDPIAYNEMVNEGFQRINDLIYDDLTWTAIPDPVVLIAGAIGG